MKSSVRPVSALAAIIALLSGCARTEAPPPSPAPTPPPVVEYKLTGVVRKVDAEHQSVTIRHDPVPGLMPEMTMPFSLRDRETLDDLKEGDEVEGSLRVVREGGEVADYELTRLTVTRPAPPPELTLSAGPDGQLTLTPTPRRLGPGDAVPDFTVTTQDGAALRLSDLRGSVVVLTFIYTRCPLPDFCPAIDRKFGDLAARLAAVPDRASKVRLLSVSFDPEHDTPEVLRKHAAMRGAAPPLWTFAVATHAELGRVGPALGLTYGPTRGEIVHNLSTAVIGPDGRLVALRVGEEGRTWQPADLLKAIYSSIAD